MPFEIHLECRYHTQDEENCCGAAAATMILHHFGLSYCSLDQGINQQTLTQLTNDPRIDGASPSALSIFLSQQPGSAKFSARNANSHEELSKHVVGSILSDTPAAVPIYAAGHWIVVDGFQTNLDPTGKDPYFLKGLWLHNPVENGDAPPPPHDDKDDCGKGDSLSGVLREFVTAQQWKLNVIATLQSPFSDFRLASVSGTPAISVTAPTFEEPPDSDHPLSDTEAIQVAGETLDSYDLRKHISATGNLQAGSPRFVKGAAGQGGDYFVIPWKDDVGFRAFSRVNSKSGWLMSVAFPSKPVLDYILTEEDVSNTLLGGLSEKFSSFGVPSFLSKRGALILENPLRRRVKSSELVWRPSIQSLSPFFPLAKVNLFAGRAIYVDQARGIHSRLVDPVIGG
jgi:hypothetical protein